MPSTRPAVATAVLALGTLPGVAAAQPSSPQISPEAQFVAAFGFSFVLGALVLAIAPRWVESVADEAATDLPVAVALGTFGYVLVLVGLFLVGLTLIGLIVTIPGLLVLAAIAIVGTPLGAYVLGRALTDAGNVENRWLSLLAGTVVLGGVSAVPIVGDLLNLLVASPGIGVLLARSKRAIADAL
ncbi:hypothetical protein [Haloarcula marina]|uniref:hypothetical protein n=1 Tax=Haloarcula marina TaxID=2961574 RepID=UPI0020B7EFD6|nr:hypothetical protein [Halomicroarcula marina]